MLVKNRNKVSELVKDINILEMFDVKQIFDEAHLSQEQIKESIIEQMDLKKIPEMIFPGMKIAIAVGSRGICNQTLVVKTIIDYVREKGADPFIVAAMGSHGKATAEGQKEVLNALGFDEKSMGCKIFSDMDVVSLGCNEEGREVFFDANAAKADGIILSCRVKPHTAFRGRYESGIMKMMAILIRYLIEKNEIVEMEDHPFLTSGMDEEEIPFYLEYLKKNKRLSVTENGIFLKLSSLKDFIADIPDERQRFVLAERISGKSLEEIGGELAIGKARVSELGRKGLNIAKALNMKRNGTCLFEEDRYVYLYENYQFDKNDFIECVENNHKLIEYWSF